VSIVDYARMRGQAASLWKFLLDFRESCDVAQIDAGDLDCIFDDVRETDTGRKVEMYFTATLF